MQATRNFNSSLNNSQNSQLNILSERCNWLFDQFHFYHNRGETDKARPFLAVYFEAQADLQNAIDKAMARMVRNESY